jgi:hypothetical protein
MPRKMAKIKASVAPTPAPSVGVNAPSQMPPSRINGKHFIVSIKVPIFITKNVAP